MESGARSGSSDALPFVTCRPQEETHLAFSTGRSIYFTNTAGGKERFSLFQATAPPVKDRHNSANGKPLRSKLPVTPVDFLVKTALPTLSFPL